MTEDRIIKLARSRGIRQHSETHEWNWFLIQKMIEEGKAEWVDGYLRIVHNKKEKMSITRSKMKEVLSTVTDESTVVDVLLLVLDHFGKWEEEEKTEEWPKLTPAANFRGWGFVAERDGSRLVLKVEEADKIARVWEARRPGGPMEESLLALAREAESYNDFTETARFGARLRKILEETTNEKGGK